MWKKIINKPEMGGRIRKQMEKKITLMKQTK